MRKHGNWFPAAVAALVLAVGLTQAVAADATADPAGAGTSVATASTTTSDLREVRVEATGHGRPVVTLTGSGAMRYSTTVLDDPPRLVMDLEGTTARLERNQYAVQDGGVLRVRAGQYRRTPTAVSRIVFDLEHPVAYRVEADGDRLVVRFGDDGTGPNATGTAPESAPAEIASAPIEPARPAESAPEPAHVAETTPPAASPAPAAPVAAAAAAEPTRDVAAGTLDELLKAPELAAEEESGAVPSSLKQTSFETRTIASDQVQYTGKKISLNLVDTDVKQVFRLFHDISGLNFVLDPSVDGKVTIVLDNVPWDQALDIILKNNGFDKVFENNVIRIASTQKLAAEAAARKQLRETKELEVEPVTITRTLSYAKAKDVEKVIREGGILSARGKVIVDERTNALIISDIPKKVDPLDRLISTLDTETPQVMIEARIVETNKTFTQDFGVQWGFNAIADASRGTSTGLSFPRNASVKYGLNLPGAGTANTLAFKFGNILDSFTLDLALNALETEGRGRILSSPKIATQNNERAEIEQGVRIPVVNTTATEINVEFVSASLKLSVTPQITSEGTVILDINVENNSADFTARVGDVPAINTQRAQTKVLITDGGTAVIGGIFTVNEGTSEAGVPWFRKIPGLGWLFKTRNITNENRELLIFITPKIMRIG